MIGNRRNILVLVCGVLTASLLPGKADFQGSTHLMPFDEEPISYSKGVPDGAIERLQAKIDKGEVKLQFEPGYGYIRSVLQALKVPESSQMLVFSKTSLQRERISPKTPRSIFFNDDIYLGFIPGAPLVEVS